MPIPVMIGDFNHYLKGRGEYFRHAYPETTFVS
jgi:hypothetical protein